MLDGIQLKSSHFHKAAALMNRAQGTISDINPDETRTRHLLLLTKGALERVLSQPFDRGARTSPANYQLSTQAFDDALNSFEILLALRPTSIPSLLGKVGTRA